MFSIIELILGGYKYLPITKMYLLHNHLFSLIQYQCVRMQGSTDQPGSLRTRAAAERKPEVTSTLEAATLSYGSGPYASADTRRFTRHDAAVRAAARAPHPHGSRCFTGSHGAKPSLSPGGAGAPLERSPSHRGGNTGLRPDTGYNRAGARCWLRLARGGACTVSLP